MIIDCDTCVMRDVSCADCVVTALLGTAPGVVELDSCEQDAFGALAGCGLVPPLRLVPKYAPPRRPDEAANRSAPPPGERAG